MDHSLELISHISNLIRKPFRGRVKYEPGPDQAGSGSIIDYDVKFLLDLGWSLFYRGTFWQNATVEGVVVGVIGATFLALNKCTGTDIHKCVPVPSGGNSAITLTALASFLVGLFVNTLLTRWWALRMHILGFVGLHNEVTIHFASALANGGLASESLEMQEEAKRACYAVYRHTCIANYLVVMNANKDTDYIPLHKKGIITTSELGSLQNSSGSPNVVYGWIDARVEKLAEAGFLGPYPGVGYCNLRSILEVIGRCRANCIAAGVYVDSQLPYPLIQMVSMVVYLFLFQIIIVCGGNIGVAYQGTNYGVMLSYFFTLVLTMVIFRSFLAIYDMLYNPLGDDVADYPTKTWLGGAEKGMLGLINMIFNVSLTATLNAQLNYTVDEMEVHTRSSLKFLQDAKLTQKAKKRSRYAKSATDDGADIRRIDESDTFIPRAERWRQNKHKIHPESVKLALSRETSINFAAIQDLTQHNFTHEDLFERPKDWWKKR